MCPQKQQNLVARTTDNAPVKREFVCKNRKPCRPVELAKKGPEVEQKKREAKFTA